jgi:ribosomal protein L35
MTTIQKKEFYCDKCNYTCIYESHWKQHTESKKHQNIDRQPRSDKVLEPKCKLCQFESNNLTNMTVHILTKHSTPDKRKKEFKYYCEKCDFGTFTEILFTRHQEAKKHIANYKVDVKSQE